MNNSLSAGLVVLVLRTDHRSRRGRHHVSAHSGEFKQPRRQWRRHAEPNVFADHSSAASNGEALINSSESQTQTQLNNPPLVFIVFLLAHSSVTKTVMTIDEVGHVVTVFIGSLLTQKEGCTFKILHSGAAFKCLQFERRLCAVVQGFSSRLRQLGQAPADCRKSSDRKWMDRTPLFWKRKAKPRLKTFCV